MRQQALLLAGWALLSLLPQQIQAQEDALDPSRFVSAYEKHMSDCRTLEDDLERRVAACRNRFRLGEVDPDEIRIGWEESETEAEVPAWVPRIKDLLAKSNLAERAEPILKSRPRTWDYERGEGGELVSRLWFAEAVAHHEYITAFEEAGFLVAEWTSKPDHYLPSGRTIRYHHIVANHPWTCHAVYVVLIEYPFAKLARLPETFEGPVTRILVAFRGPAAPDEDPGLGDS